MAATLTIRDGTPYWWDSPDIWVVPGDDPAGPAGAPVAGTPAYLWAHVANSGASDANGARVDFFWANPALQVLRSTSTMIGSAFADVAAGHAQDVLCLVPWTPVIVNGGHECVVAVVNHAADPLPAPPPDDFDPPAFHQVAQRNLAVLPASQMLMPLALTLSAPRRAAKSVRVRVEFGGELGREAMRRLDLREMRPATGRPVTAGLRREAACGHGRDVGAPELELSLPRGTQAAVHLSLHDEGLRRGEYQLVHVIEHDENRMLGGYTVVVIGESKGGRS
jgi:hypothetical protein